MAVSSRRVLDARRNARPKVLSYGTRLALLARATDPVVDCVIPTAKGLDCLAAVKPGERVCGPHQKTVAKRATDLMLALR